MIKRKICIPPPRMYLCDLNLTDEHNYVHCEMNYCFENPWQIRGLGTQL